MWTTKFKVLSPRFRLNYNKASIENIVFELHYKYTVTVLIAFVVLVCTREYFKEHIKCIVGGGVESDMINNFCFFMATFSVIRHYDERLLQSGFLPHPGVGPLANEDQTMIHRYYQWVPFVLFLQSILFYLPHHFWKKAEGGRIKTIMKELEYVQLAVQEQDIEVNGYLVPSKVKLSNKIDHISDHVIQLLRNRLTRPWSTMLVPMEIVNFIHLLIQIWIINIFLNGNFMNLGPRVLNYSEWEYIADPLETIFPKVTKCLFYKYGPSGTIQQYDALCVMSLNIIYEKIYTILWFWYLFMFIVSLLILIWRATSYLLYRRAVKFSQFVFSRVSQAKIDVDSTRTIVSRCQYSDWLFLYYLAKNIPGFVFQEVFWRLSLKLKMDSNGRDDGNGKYSDETLPLKDSKRQ
ncbi:innexin inx7-like [Aphomia sociella]